MMVAVGLSPRIAANHTIRRREWTLTETIGSQIRRSVGRATFAESSEGMQSHSVGGFDTKGSPVH